MSENIELTTPPLAHPEASPTKTSPRKELASHITQAAREIYEAHRNPAADESRGTSESSHEERLAQQRSALNEFVNRIQLETNPTEADVPPAHGVTMSQYDTAGGELPNHITELLKSASHPKGGSESFVIRNPKSDPHIVTRPITLIGLKDDRQQTTYYYFIRSGDDPGEFAMDGLQEYPEEAGSPPASFTPYNHNLNLLEIADIITRSLRTESIPAEK